MKHDVRIYPQPHDQFFAACLTDNGSCQFEAKGDLDEVSPAIGAHYRSVGQ